MVNIIPLYNSVTKHMYHIGKIVKKKHFQDNTNKIVKVNIFCRPEEAMLETGESLLTTKYFLFLEKFELSSA